MQAPPFDLPAALHRALLPQNLLQGVAEVGLHVVQDLAEQGRGQLADAGLGPGRQVQELQGLGLAFTRLGVPPHALLGQPLQAVQPTSDLPQGGFELRPFRGQRQGTLAVHAWASSRPSCSACSMAERPLLIS